MFINVVKKTDATLQDQNAAFIHDKTSAPYTSSIPTRAMIINLSVSASSACFAQQPNLHYGLKTSASQCHMPTTLHYQQSSYVQKRFHSNMIHKNCSSSILAVPGQPLVLDAETSPVSRPYIGDPSKTKVMLFPSDLIFLSWD